MNHNRSTLGGRSMKLFTATLVVGLWLCLAATALPSDNLPPRGPQGLPGPGPSSPPVAPSPGDAPAADAPPSVGPQGLPGPGPSSPPVAPSPNVGLAPPDKGLSPFTILLITLGGTLVLTGVAYIATRAAQHRRAVS
jgi:hypothetical protein